MIILEENFKWHLEAFASELFIYIHTYINTLSLSLSLPLSLSPHQCVKVNSSLQRHMKLNSLLNLFSKRSTSLFPLQSRHCVCVYTCACPYVCAFVFHNAVQHFSFWHKSPAPRTAECVREGEREGRETDGETQRQIETGRNKKKEGAEKEAGKRGCLDGKQKMKEKGLRLKMEWKN